MRASGRVEDAVAFPSARDPPGPPMTRPSFFAALLLVTSGSVCRADWPQWRGPERDGKAVGESMRVNWSEEPPELLWTAEGLGDGYASVAIVGGVVYTMGDFDGEQRVVAVDLASRSVLWATALPVQGADHGYPGSRCTPTVVGDRMYVVGSVGSVACLTTDGEVVWSKSFAREYGSEPQRWGYAESPLVDGDAVLCTPGSSSALIVKLERETGRELWRTPFPAKTGPKGKDQAGYSSMVVASPGGVRQYLQNTGRGVVGVRTEDGKLLWGSNESANRTAVIPTPLVDGDVVVASSSYKNGTVAVRLSPSGDDAVRAEQVYFLDGKTTFENHHGQMILHEGYIYAGHAQNNGFPMCIEFATGRIAWGGRKNKLRNPAGTKGSAAVTFADGHVIWRYQSGDVVVTPATPDGYKIAGRFTPAVVDGKPSWAHPVVLDGKLYLRENGVLMCYDVSDS
ncbi:MAG: PQQ-binding-like beta-propeller repeat protein [Planctomycetota bacterium]